ncbi:MAG TPA: gliding motility-associated C-terminal domain-containing protein [Bacteroidia bacterium]|nr:gliding motility-associated C-terminal domain-containing protein [Bacteroidia bacterium]
MVVITELEFEIWIPNVFTPNRDNRNDTFTASGIGITKFDMSIFDRWGMEIFHTTDINKGWNGHIQGSSTDCLMDTYIYYISALDSRNNEHQFIGRVTLIK